MSGTLTFDVWMRMQFGTLPDGSHACLHDEDVIRDLEMAFDARTDWAEMLEMNEIDEKGRVSS